MSARVLPAPPGLSASDCESATQSRERRRIALVVKELSANLLTEMDAKILEQSHTIRSHLDAIDGKLNMVLSDLALLLGDGSYNSCMVAGKSSVANSNCSVFDICSETCLEETSSSTRACSTTLSDDTSEADGMDALDVWALLEGSTLSIPVAGATVHVCPMLEIIWQGKSLTNAMVDRRTSCDVMIGDTKNATVESRMEVDDANGDNSFRN